VRRLTAALILLGALSGSVRAAPADLCSALSVPKELGLSCEAADPATRGIVIQPTKGDFASLSRMTVWPLDPVKDKLAWSDPTAWLRQHVAIDTSGVAGALGNLVDDPDSPFGGSVLKGALGTLMSGLDSLAKAPLAACDEPASRSHGRWDMRCTFGADGLGLDLVLRIQAAGDDRYGVNMRTMNEQRLRHLEAIANSFAPD
jgi:hypothetical protein